MKFLLRVAIIVCFGIAMLPYQAALALAEPSLEDTKKLLEKSLTLYEIDQEIARLSEQESEIAASIAQNGKRIEQQQRLVDHTRLHAGQVLRAYYTGERDSIWMLLFSARSFSDAIAMFEYLTMIVQNDRRALRKHASSYSDLKALQAQLLDKQKRLNDVKSRFLIQRERVAKLQQEVKEAMARIPEADLQDARQQMQRLTADWETKGLPLFKTYFQALSDAMMQLPQILTTNKNSLIMQDFNYTFQITDGELNEFLRSQNPMFEQLTFSFEDGHITANGKQDGVEVTLSGHYVVETEPANVIAYRIDELKFNGLALPDTTRNALQNQFNLAIYPQKIAPFLLATGVEIQTGKLIVTMKLNLRP